MGGLTSLLEKILSVFYARPEVGFGLTNMSLDLHLRYPLYYAFTTNLRLAEGWYPMWPDRLRVLVGTSLSMLEGVAGAADAGGIEYDALGYALERSSPVEEWQHPVEAVAMARQLADDRDRALLLGMGGRLADDNTHKWPMIAPFCDYWVLQAQRHQAYPPGREWRRAVNSRVSRLKHIRPEMPVIVQVSITPGPYRLTPEEVYRYIVWLKGLRLDAVSIYPAKEPQTIEWVLRYLWGQEGEV